MKALGDLFLAELADRHDAEHRSPKAPPRLVRVATGWDLQQALLTHLYEIEGKVAKLEQVLKSFREKARAGR